jgi:hypothetical protein
VVLIDLPTSKRQGREFDPRSDQYIFFCYFFHLFGTVALGLGVGDSRVRCWGFIIGDFDRQEHQTGTDLKMSVVLEA